MRVLFFGTPAFAVASLERLASSGHAVVGVITQPDRPRGRGHAVSPPDVRIAAERLGLDAPVLQPTRLKTDESLDLALADLEPDIGVVAAYGRLLPQRLLDLPARGMVNVHASLLPRWRGAAPVHRAILAGDTETGVSIMRVVLALDAGPVLARRRLAIGPDETSGALEGRLAHAGADLLVVTLDRLAAGHLTAEPQDDTAATYASRLLRTDSPLDFSRPADVVHNQIRGLQPWPQAATWIRGRRILVKRSSGPMLAPTGRAPGTILDVAGDRVQVAASPGSVWLDTVQPEGRAAISARALLNGLRLQAGDRFDPPPVDSR